MAVIGVIAHLDRNAKGNGATSPDAVVEAFRGLRLSLVNEYDPASGPIVVTVTSPGSGDGKSFVSSNLALAFSYAKQRTLLVDADLRRGVLHRVQPASAAGIDGLPRRGCCPRARLAEDVPSVPRLH